MKRHPAFEIFERLFNEAAKDPGPTLPTYFVTRDIFHKACRLAGLSIPADWIGATAWEESIGLPEFSHRIFAHYHKEHGSDFTPMEKGAWRLRQKMRRKPISTHPRNVSKL